MSNKPKSIPRYIQVSPHDNVAIVVNEGGLPAGTQFENGLRLTENIPEAHKLALIDIEAGAPIIRYGAVIGHATERLAGGTWVHEGRMRLPPAPSLVDLPLPNNSTSAFAPVEVRTFEGFLNDDGSVGTKNILGITTTVQCVAATVDFAVKRIKSEILPRYPHVDDVISLTHDYGCGVAIDAPGAEIPIRTLRNLSLNPNLGGSSMVVSLGCEKLQPQRLFPTDAFPVISSSPYIVRLQDEQYRSFGDMVTAIMELAEKRLSRLNQRRRTVQPASSLVVGLQCGGSDAMSGVTANPAIGFAADLLVNSGATVLFSEVTEVRDAIQLITSRAKDESVVRDLVREMAWYDRYLERGGADRTANPTPGNKYGGIANVVEKALGSIAKAGNGTISAVFGPGERVTKKGLIFAATPASDFVCGTLQLAAGMNVHIFSTGRGTPYGLAMAPVIKVASRTALAERWSDLIDIDAGKIATGAGTIQQVGNEIFEFVLQVASGRVRACADRLGLHNDLALFNPAPIT